MLNLTKKNKYKRNIKGFSLIELMVVVTILSFMVLGLVTFFTGGARSWISGQNQLKAQREARMAMDIMVKEIREGKSVVNEVEHESYENGVTISFPAALGGGMVTFELVGNSVKRNGINTIIDNIPEDGLFFTYFNDVGEVEVLTQASKLRIVLQVDVDGDMSSGGNPDITIETEVNLRNYGLTG
jgi:prepilin-type N-terminal cleavage/methylation domain-containing protein